MNADELSNSLFRAAAMIEAREPDDAVVTTEWARVLSDLEPRAEQGVAVAQVACGLIYAANNRSVPQNWVTAAKWWKRAADAGDTRARFFMGTCHLFGRGVDRDYATAFALFVNNPHYNLMLSLGGKYRRNGFEPFTSRTSSALVRLRAAHWFAEKLRLHHDDAAFGDFIMTPGSISLLGIAGDERQDRRMRDGFWVRFMMQSGICDLEVKIAKKMYAYAQRACSFCGSKSAVLKTCGGCMKARYCSRNCQKRHWRGNSEMQSHKETCARDRARGGEGVERRE